MSWSMQLVNDLKQFISLLCSQNDDQITENVQTYSIQDACVRVQVRQTTQPKKFHQYILNLLAILRKFIDFADPSLIVLLYEAIKSNIYQFPQIYNQENYHPAIIQYVHLISLEISKIFSNPFVTTLNINTDIDQKQLAYLDTNTITVLNYVFILKKVIEIINFRGLMPGLIQQFYPDAQCGKQSVQTAFFISIAQFSRIKGIQQQHDTIQILYKGLINKNPKVRYYAIRALIHFSKQLDSQKFHQLYIDQFVPLLILGLNDFDDDFDEDLACQRLICFNLFVSKLDQKKDTLKNNLEFFRTKVCFFIQSSIGNKIKGCVLDCLVLLAEISQCVSLEEISKCLMICYDIFISFQAQQQVAKKALLCICEIIAGINYQNEVQKYIETALDTLLYFIDQIQIDTLLDCWKLLCLTGIKFQNWTLIFQNVFKIAKEYCQSNKFSLRSIAYSIFKCTSICLEIKTDDYFIPVIQMIVIRLRIAVKSGKKDQVQQICSAFNAIISSQRPKQKQSKYFHQKSNKMKEKINKMGCLTFSKQYLSTIMQTFKQFQRQLKKAHYNQNQINVFLLCSFKVLIEYFGDILPKTHHNQLLRIFWSKVQAFDDMKKKQKYNMRKNNKMYSLNIVRVTLPLILGSIIKHIHLGTTYGVLTNTLNYIYNSSMNDSDIICITRYIAALQLLPSLQIQQHYPRFIQFFMDYSVHPQLFVRTEISYTVGIMVSQTPINDFQAKLASWLKILYRCISKAINSSDSIQDLGICLDNCISAIGHIIHRFGNYYNLYNLHNIWLHYLPLKYNKEQYIQQIDLLTNLVIFQPHTIIQLNINISQDEQQRLQAITKVQMLLTIFSKAKFQIEKQPKIRDNIDTLQRIQLAVSHIQQWQLFKAKQSMNLSKEQFKH